MLEVFSNSKKSLYFTEKIKKEINKIPLYPLTIIEAPMGYGKTTAVREVLKDISTDVLWQNIYDDSINNLWGNICETLKVFDCSSSEAFRELGIPNDSVSREEALMLISQIQSEEPTIIVLDDYHLIKSKVMNDFITFIVKNEVTNLNIVIITQENNIEEIDELKVRGYVLHITKNIFEFEAADIADYYGVNGVYLCKEELDKVYTYTEGWISAVFLLMLIYKREKKANLDIFSSINSIYILLEKSVYECLSNEMQDFIASIFIFDCFTEEQAEFIWGRANTSEQLKLLVDNNLFIFYDDFTKRYYMHNILKNYAKSVLIKKGEEYTKMLYSRAARWFINTGDYLKPMEYYYRINDFESIFGIYEINKGKYINFESRQMLKKYYKECPCDIRYGHPTAVFIYLLDMFAFNYSDGEGFEEEYIRFVENIRTRTDMDEDLRCRYLGEIEVLSAVTKYNNLSEITAHLKRAYELTKAPCSFIDKSCSVTLGSPSIMYLFYRKPGELKKVVSQIKEASAYYYRLTNNHGYGAEYAASAEMNLLTGNFSAAEEDLNIAERMSSISYEDGVFITVMFTRIRLAVFKGDIKLVRTVMKKMKRLLPEFMMSLYMHTYDMSVGSIFAYLNYKDRIPPWILKGEIENPRVLYHTKGFLNIVYGRVLLIQAKYEILLEHKDSFMETASVFPNLLGSIYTIIYTSAALKETSRASEASELLKEALDMALPDGLYIPFVENCDYIKPVLLKLVKLEKYSLFINSVINIYNDCSRSIEKVKMEVRQSQGPKLNDIEFQVARLAADGLSNNEIGEKLHMPSRAVHKVLKSVFNKSGVKSRSLLKYYFDN